jgi:hypothetical protein
VPSTRTKTDSRADYDVFVCCPDPAQVEACATLVAYLRRGGFRVFDATEHPGLPAAERLAVAESASDLVLFLPPADGETAPAGSGWQAEVSAALGTGRNIIRVTMAAAPTGDAGSLPPDLDGLAGQQSAIYDPDRLAESLSVIQHCLSTDGIVNDRHMMRRTKRWFVFAGLLVLAGFTAQSVPMVIEWWKRPRPKPPVAPMVLHWTAFGERQTGGRTEEFPLTSGAAVKGGDRLRVAFSTSADGFAYVIAKDSHGRVWVAYPGETLRNASRVRAGRSYHAPAASEWLTVDAEAGLETLYVFASYDPLQNLEELIEEPEVPNSTGSRRALVDQTVAGLIDGRHYPAGPRVWIRSTALVDQDLKPAPGPPSFTASLSSGQQITHPASVVPGVVNALAEIKVTFAR